MSTRTFILSLVTLLIAAGGFVWWTSQDASEKKAIATSQPASPTEKAEPKASPTAEASTRFQNLTDPSIRWEVRVDRLRRLDASTLTSADIDALYALLKHQVSAANQQEAWWVVMNEVMEQLQKQQIAPERFDQAMLALIQDPSLDMVVRDYAVQHLCIALKNGERRSNRQQRAQEMIPALLETLQTPSALHSSIAGTTLLSLVDAASAPSVAAELETALEQLQPTLMPLITGTTPASLSTRTSAIHAVGRLGRSEYLPAIRQIIQSDQSDASAKLSAIAALGSYYQTQDQDAVTDNTVDTTLLEQIASSNTPFKYAAQSALNKLSN